MKVPGLILPAGYVSLYEAARRAENLLVDQGHQDIGSTLPADPTGDLLRRLAAGEVVATGVVLPLAYQGLATAFMIPQPTPGALLIVGASEWVVQGGAEHLFNAPDRFPWDGYLEIAGVRALPVLPCIWVDAWYRRIEIALTKHGKDKPPISAAALHAWWVAYLADHEAAGTIPTNPEMRAAAEAAFPDNRAPTDDALAQVRKTAPRGWHVPGKRRGTTAAKSPTKSTR